MNLMNKKILKMTYLTLIVPISFCMMIIPLSGCGLTDKAEVSYSRSESVRRLDVGYLRDQGLSESKINDIMEVTKDE